MLDFTHDFSTVFAHSFIYSLMHPSILQKGMKVDGSSWNDLLTNWCDISEQLSGCFFTLFTLCSSKSCLDKLP